jgi:hypothetical protein
MLRTWHPKRYAKSIENRLHGHDAAAIGARRSFLKAALLNFLMLQLLFLALYSYVFGSLFQQNSHLHNLNVLFVDYDDGLIGTAVRGAYNDLRGDSFPTVIEQSVSQFPSPENLKSAVCNAKYWAAYYTSPGATARLEEALVSGSAAMAYNQSNAMTLIWNEARYPAVIDANIVTPLQTLTSAARLAYTAMNGTGALQTLNLTDPAVISVFANPWQLASVDIQPTTQGSRLIYNTIVFILVLLQEFFYLGTINALYLQFNIYAHLYPHRIILYRNAISLAYTFVGSLCTTGAIWAFRSGWNVNANQFVLSWMVFWIFAHADFMALDVFTIWLPIPYVPMALVTWVIISVTSILIPFELSPGFYKWAYAIPAHEVYQVLIDIWSRGCNAQLSYALPILFSWELVGLFVSNLGVYRRCHYAKVAEEMQEIQFRERLDAAIASKWKRDEEAKDAPERESDAIEQAETGKIKEHVDFMPREDGIQRDMSKADTNCNFGPSFGLAFQSKD